MLPKGGLIDRKKKVVVAGEEDEEQECTTPPFSYFFFMLWSSSSNRIWILVGVLTTTSGIMSEPGVDTTPIGGNCGGGTHHVVE